MRAHRLPFRPGIRLLTLMVVVMATAPAMAQIPDTFTNLMVLPTDTSKGDLVGMMRGFSGALGVRCIHCHVGGDPETLQGFDFASDEKEPKRVARLMMKMMNDINQVHLAKIGRDNALQVGCVTCHHGIERPESLRDLMLSTVRKDGTDAAVKLYKELRDKHHGGAAYDFSAGPLNGVTEQLAQGRDLEAAEAMIRLNIEFNPEAMYSHFLLSRLQQAAGDTDGAVSSLERALAIEPDSAWIKGQLDKLKASVAPPAAE